MEDEDRNIFEGLMAEEETKESMSFLLRLGRDQKQSFLVYVRILQDIVRHKEEQGNSATDLYVDRKYAHLRQEIERLRTERDVAALRPLEEKLNQILGAVDTRRVRTATALGQEGEDWVLGALHEAFPALTGCKAFLTKKPHCGDIVLQTENMSFMFEVKNYKASPLKGQGQGQQLDKFFSDAIRPGSGYR